MYGHLVAVEVGVEGRADQGMQLDGFAFYQGRLKGLNPKTMKGWRAVEHHGIFLDDFIQRVPDLGNFALHHFFGALDG